MRYTPRDELDRRCRSLQGLIRRRGAQGALIVQNADLYYFAGTIQRSHLFIPAEGKPLLLVKKSYPRARQESSLEEVVPLENLKDLPGVLASYGYTRLESVGMELDVLPAALYLKYRDLLQPAEVVDLSHSIRTVRMVKSAYEIEALKGAAELSRAMFARVGEYLREGISEVELAGRLEAEYRRLGHQGYVRMRGFNQEVAYGHLMSGSNLAVPSFLDSPEGGPGVNPSFPQGPGIKRIARNEPVMVDYVGVWEGYMVDQARIFCLGRLPELFTRAHEAAISIQEEIKKSARPGVLCEDLYGLALRMASEYGLKENFMGFPEPAPFVGHGVGIELDELPVLAKGFKTPLAEGMVLALEPKFVFPAGEVGIENTFVVGEKGLQPLTYFDEQIQYL